MGEVLEIDVDRGIKAMCKQNTKPVYYEDTSRIVVIN